MGAIVGGLSCALGGILIWEGVQWRVWGPPHWLPGWVPVGKKMDPDPVEVPLYDEAAVLTPASDLDLPRGHSVDQVWLDEPWIFGGNPTPNAHPLGVEQPQPLLGDDALAMLRAGGIVPTPGQEQVIRGPWADRPGCGPGIDRQPTIHAVHYGPGDEPTPEPVSADSYTSGGATRADLADPQDQAVAAAMNAGTPTDVPTAELPDWLTPPPARTSKPCACGDRVMASNWNRPAHVAHRTQARAELDQHRKD